MGAWVMAGVTFREAARKKFLWMALLAGAGLIALFSTGLFFQLKDRAPTTNPLLLRQIVNGMLMVGLYAVDGLAVVMTVLTSVDTLSGEIASGTVHAIATKPVPRWQILLGKWLGFMGMLSVYLFTMVGGITLATYALSSHYATGVTPHHFIRGMGLMWIECVLLLTLTFFFGTKFSTLTNGVLALGFHALAFIGGWIEQAGALTHSPRAVTVGIVASLIMPSESLWRRAEFEMQSPVIGSLQFSPFSNASVPSPAMVAYAVIYIAVFLGLAIHRFGRRDL
ncbi:MAG TPA: ABC transporter permease subunit [Terriglobia bacterium]|nr:ABC transporter permease subunit [Terriglobia bacterium]